MTELEQKHVQESERALTEFLERQRQQRVASDILSAAFRDSEIDPRTVSDNEADSDHEDAKEAARQYAQACNSNARVRVYAQDNESQRQGVQAALNWLSRKKKSAIKK